MKPTIANAIKPFTRLSPLQIRLLMIFFISFSS
jgi:hypothetical protein